MNTQTTIRPTNNTDLAAIASIAAQTGLFPAEALDDMVAGYLDGTKDDIWLIAEHDGQPAGFAFCEPERFTNGSWNLLAIGVSPERQSQGIGASLTRHLEKELRQAGQRILIVETIGTPEFSRTRSFYLANGYVEEARIREFWDVGADKVTFWKHL